MDIVTGEITQLPSATGEATEPAWLNNDTLLFTMDGVIWQTPLDGSEALVFQQSDGTINAQADVSRSGGTVAFISTRGGQRDIWVERSLQLGALVVQPRSVLPGQPTSVVYTLPASANVTLTIQNASGDTIATFDDMQPAGVRTWTWDTTNVPEGAYRVHLVAQIGDMTLERFGDASIAADQVVEATVEPTATQAVETLEPVVTPTAAVEESLLRVTAYANETTTAHVSGLVVEATDADGAIVATTEGQNPAQLTLPTGVYNVTLRYVDDSGNAVNHTFEGVSVPEVSALTYPASSGTLIATYFSGTDVTDFLSTRLFIYAPGDRETVLAERGFGNPLRLDLQEGTYDIVMANTNAINSSERVFEDVQIGAGVEVSLSHVFPVGQVQAVYFSGEGVSDFLSTRLRVYAPDDRETVLADLGFGNPLELNLPEGTYDIVMANVDDSSEQEMVFEDVVITAGQRLTLEHNFGVGQVDTMYFSGEGVTDFLSTRLFVYAPDDRATVLADSGFSNPLRLNLPEGTYDIVMANVNDIGEQEMVFEDAVITAGERLTLEHNFEVGQVNATYFSSEGVTDFLSTRLRVYVPGDRETLLADSGFGNPLRLNLPEGTYDVVMVNVDDTGEVSQVFEGLVINAGQVTEISHVFNVGAVHVAKPASGNIRVTAYNPDDLSVELASSGFSDPVRLILPAGVYTLVVTEPSTNTEIQRFESVTVTAGQILALEIAAQ